MELKCYDMLLLRAINTNVDIFELVVQDRLISENPIELDFDKCVKLTKSFIRNQKVIGNAQEWGIPDQAIEQIIKINEGTEISIYDYESMLLALRYSGFSLVIIGRSDIEVIDNETTMGEFDVMSYLLDGFHNNTTGLTNFYIGTSRIYKNDGSGVYPYAIDFVNDLGLSDEEKQAYDIQASLDNYMALASLNELQSFNDQYARAVIKAKDLRFIRIKS